MDSGTTNNKITVLVAIIILLIGFYVVGMLGGYNTGYKQGQIDALTKNKVIYCLKTDTLNQSTWQLCEE